MLENFKNRAELANARSFTSQTRVKQHIAICNITGLAGAVALTQNSETEEKQERKPKGLDETQFVR